MKKRSAINFLILGIILIGFASASYCCERTTSGAWCQDVTDQTLCNTGQNPFSNGESYKAISATCEATSYCKTGTCINQQEGTCDPTAETVCTSNGGYWSAQTSDTLPQCQLGCCLLGDQAAFVTQTACNKLASDYGLTVMSYRTDITNEQDCLASANPGVEGACVYTQNYAVTCKRSTKQDCQTMQKNSPNENVSFHEGYLCSAQELQTICGKSQNTQCGEDNQVYFTDTCGNLANVYDSTKFSDSNYWTMVQKPTCGDNAGNKNSATCGACDYLSGSMCKEKGATDSTNYGAYICKNLDCTDYRGIYLNGKSATATNYPKHGESWCAIDSPDFPSGDSNAPGSSSYVLSCYNGDVTMEQCDPTRQKICSETNVGTSTKVFMTANCRANVWQDCLSQTSDSCTDNSARDCKWIKGYHIDGSDNQMGLVSDQYGGVCVPEFAPGFERDENDQVIGGESCSAVTSKCYVGLTKSQFLGGDWTCDRKNLANNCSCMDNSWGSDRNNICKAIGDCGVKTNLVGTQGTNSLSDLLSHKDVSQ